MPSRPNMAYGAADSNFVDDLIDMRGYHSEYRSLGGGGPVTDQNANNPMYEPIYDGSRQNPLPYDYRAVTNQYDNYQIRNLNNPTVPQPHYDYQRVQMGQPLPLFMDTRLRDTLSHMRNSHKRIPINQWKIVFSGDTSNGRNELSIHDFIAQVEMFRRSEDVPEDDLIRQIIHLLTGRARLWYQTEYHNISDTTMPQWSDFVRALKAKFLPNDYNYAILNDVENRKQSRDETVGMYINDMERMFRAMSMPIGEQHRVFLIRRNLLSQFRDAIASWEVNSVSELDANGLNAVAHGKMILGVNPNAHVAVVPHIARAMNWKPTIRHPIRTVQ